MSPPPLIGRTAELTRFGTLLSDVAAGPGKTTILFGEGGVGKTRLLGAVATRARKRGFTVALGRAYPVETGVPYALFADGLHPLLAQIDPAQLAVLTRGASAELAALFPGLYPQTSGNGRDAVRVGADPAETKARLLWNFSQFLTRISSRQPLLLVLENLQWADASSLELFHFVARQIPSGAKVALVGTYNETEREANPVLRTTEQSLLRLGVATVQRLEPLNQEEVSLLVQETFSVEEQVLGRFPALLYAWTRGNPFFVEETLKALVTRGTLYERDGRWFGWEVETLELPPTIRDAIAARLGGLSGDARTVANMAAVIGTRVTLGTLGDISALPNAALVPAIEELCAARVLEERVHTDAFSRGAAGSGAVAYDFTHPLLQQVLYGALGHARASLMHATIAETLESHYGARALQHADELAFHFARAHGHTLEPKAVRYLSAAGRAALQKYANREATEYLSRALEHLERTSSDDGSDELEVLVSLARARQRLGEYESALTLWQRALESATAQGTEPAEIARIRYRMGLALYWSGAYDRALEQYGASLEAVRDDPAAEVAVQVRLARAICLQDTGRLDDAAAEVHSALAVAGEVGNPALLARVHRALLIMYAWNGSADQAREHGQRAIELATAAAQPTLLWSAHWGMAMLAGIASDARGVVDHLAAAEAVAAELGSPLLPLWTAELAIQYAASTGDWESGIATGERTIKLARALGQRTLLPRLLVWTGMIYLERGEPLRAKEMFDEAWQVSGAGRESGRPVDFPSVIPAHLGLAAFHLATEKYREAVNVGEAGLAIADHAGHRVWSVQWLLPLVMEARLRALDFKEAAAHARRLREDAEKFKHRLGLACASACEGLLLLHHASDRARDHPEAARVMKAAAEQLEEIPYPYTAARIRREVARALALTGQRDAAVRELRRAHDVFARLGATSELARTREELRTLGVRPPVKVMGAGGAGLTGRELEIARMVAQRKGNKEIGSALRISARTVSTHLSNIFTKIGVESRGALADYVREKGLIEQ
ncbi:MAG TPA: AAA family ATPase [Gemmatimonadaceae bacterium]|nr:AAA family ATPase [Gemmatimonadaceae bacterium]